MGSSYSTEPISQCKMYLSLGKFNEDYNKWEIIEEFKKQKFTIEQLNDLSNIIVAKKNYRGIDNQDNNSKYWEFKPEFCRLLSINWEENYPITVYSIKNEETIFNKRYDKGEGLHRLAIHNNAFYDYIKNGKNGDIYKNISLYLEKYRVPIIKNS